MPFVTRDYFYEKEVTIFQNRDGYRFSVDAPILAHFLPVSSQPALEIGCGCGVVSLLALYNRKFPRITAVEISEDQCLLAEKNASMNNFSDQLLVVCADFKEIYQHFPKFSTIFSNPPFHSPQKGHMSQNSQVRVAKFEIALTISDLLAASAAVLNDDGSIYLIFPAERENELYKNAEKSGLYPQSIRRICPFANSKPDRLVIQLGKSKTTVDEKKPLVIFKEKGVYSNDMKIIFAGHNKDDKKT